MNQDEYTLDTSEPDVARLRGVLRLESPAAYDRLFSPIRDALATAQSYIIDLEHAVLMNSSGIRALGTLVLDAKRSGTMLTICGKASVPWQRKTIASLHSLYKEGLTIELS